MPVERQRLITGLFLAAIAGFIHAATKKADHLSLGQEEEKAPVPA